MGAISNVSDTVSTSAEDVAERDQDTLDSIFSSRGSVNLGDLPNFNSTDLSAAASAILTYPEDVLDQDIELLSATSPSSSSSSSDEEELGDFLWDAFDPAIQELM